MKERTKITLILGGIVLLVIGVISASFAFLSITKKQDLANNFTSGCLNISIENESNAITLNNTYPITDVEGLKDEGYTFTIKNTCSTSTNYQINLESLNQVANTLDTQYIKTSLSSDTMDNLIQKLDSSMVTKAYIENAYVSHNLYKGTIEGNSTKEFNLKLWIDYDTTKEQGASKAYTSKINVIANPNLEVETTLEIKTTLVDNTLEGTITGIATTAQYCISNDNICTPNTSTTITDNKINITVPKRTETVAVAFGNIEVNVGEEAIVCTKVNNKTYCSNSIEKEANPDFSKVATTDEGVYAVADGMYGGTSYYWRGAVTNNYVKFAGFCWRIIRINGDGSIRLIYDGTTCHTNGTNTIESIIKVNQVYNLIQYRSENVGWTYIEGLQRTTEGSPSDIKIQTDAWFDETIVGTYAEKVTVGKFCNDREVAEGNTWESQSSNRFDYAAFERLNSTKSPILACPSGDVYDLKVGVITVDEATFAGGSMQVTNNEYYLYNGRNYWTMSPYDWYVGSDDTDGHASMFSVYSDGSLSWGVLGTNDWDLRPVINLKADTIFKLGGNGTLDNPYEVL